MDKISRLYAKTPIVKRSISSLGIQWKKPSQPLKSPADRILFLQRTIGNQAVQRLIISGTLQAKLKIGPPGDKYEQEADRVAGQVMRMEEPGVQRQVEPEEEETLQAKPLANQITLLVQRQPKPEEGEEEEETLQTRKLPGQSPDVTPSLSSSIQSLKGDGQALPESTRSYFEPRFGYDFSQVKVHADVQAAEMARAVNARAFTMGKDVFFGDGQYAPESDVGKRLMAHELTHAVQQSGIRGNLVRHRSPRRIAPKPLDLPLLDRELKAGGIGFALTQTSGEIGDATAKGGFLDPPTKDSTLPPITAEVYTAPRQKPTLNKACQTPAGLPNPACKKALFSPSDRLDCLANAKDPGLCIKQLFPARPKRALVVGGIHGNELGPLAIMKRLRKELGSPKAPLRREFDTIVIPEMNPGGVKDGKRWNRRIVDLNRNFPGLSGYPAPTARYIKGVQVGGKVPPEQLETKAVRKVIEILKPDRILALHAISNEPKTKTKKARGGVYADPVEGQARELACRMAQLMLGPKATGAINVKGNKIDLGVCNSRYPGAPPTVTKAQSSLGAWASAPKKIGGRETIVITHEVSEKTKLPEHGAGRSVDIIMPGIKAFLLDNTASHSQADALLKASVTEAFLMGKSAAKGLRRAIKETIKERFEDMNKYYKTVWRGSQPQPKTTQGKLPKDLRPPKKKGKKRPWFASDVRSFDYQAKIVRGQLKKKSINKGSSVDDIEKALRNILLTRSMPGFSRHHWGTEIDVLSAERTDWQGSGQYVPVIPFLQTEARKFGFYHPYTTGYTGQSGFPQPKSPHYLEEPWHLSYWPIAQVLQKEWARIFKGAKLDALITETAKALVKGRGTNPKDMKKALDKIGLAHYQTNVAPPP